MLKKTFTAATFALSLGFAATATAQNTEQDVQGMWNGQASNSQFDILDAATWVAPLKGIPGAVPEGQPSSINLWQADTWTLEAFLKPAPIPKFDLSRPSGYAVFLKPSTYAGMMNPATYSQFMLPEFWVPLVNPVSWLSWMNPFEYVEFLNPLAYMQWMNPVAYTDFMNPINYLEPFNPVNYLVYMNPKTYLEWFNGEAYTFKGMMNGQTNPIDLLDPTSWNNSVTTTYDPFNPITWLGN